MTKEKFNEIWLESWHLEKEDLPHLKQRLLEKYGEDVYIEFLEKEREMLYGPRGRKKGELIDLNEIERMID